MQQGSGLLGQHAGCNFDLMIQFVARQKLKTGAEGATFGIIGAVDESWDTRLDDCAGAHRARLERDIKSGVGKAIVAENSRGFAQHNDFGMRSGIIVANGAIAGARQVHIIVNQHRADRDFAGIRGSASLFESKAHEMEIVRHAKREYHGASAR